MLKKSPAALKAAIWISLMSTGLTLVWFALQNIFSDPAYPFSTPFFRPEDRFADFRNGHLFGADPFAQLRPDHGNFPFFIAVFRIFSLFPVDLALGIYILGFCALLFSILSNLLRANANQDRSGVVLFTLAIFVSYPVLFLIDRGNIEGLVFLLTFAGINDILSGKSHRGAVLMGVAGAMKPFPLIFLALFLRPFRLAPAAIGLLVSLTLSLGSLLIMPRGFFESAQVMFENLASYRSVYVQGMEGAYFGNSLHTLIKFLKLLAGLPAYVNDFKYMILVGVLTLFGLLQVVLTRDFFVRVLTLTCLMVLLPEVSAHYRLLYLIIPLVMLVQGQGEFSERTRLVFVALIVSTLCFKGFWHPLDNELNSDSLINPILLIVLLLLPFSLRLLSCRSLKVGIGYLKSSET